MKRIMLCTVVFIYLFINPSVAEDLTSSKDFFDQNTELNREDYHQLIMPKINFATSNRRYSLRVSLSFSNDDTEKYFQKENSKQKEIIGSCYLYKFHDPDFSPVKLFATGNFTGGSSGKLRNYFGNKEESWHYYYLTLLEKNNEMIHVPKGTYILDCKIYVKKEIPRDLDHLITVLELNMIK